MVPALHAEWTKFRTVPGLLLLMVGAIVGTIALSAVALSAAGVCPGPGCLADPVKTSLTGVLLGQVVVAVFGVLSVGAEYSSGMIITTLSATPARGTVLLAKAMTITTPVLVAGGVAFFGSLVAGELLLPDGASEGYRQVDLGTQSTIRAGIGSVLYLVLVALLSLGIATAVRSSAAAIGIVLGLLFVLPVVAAVITDPDWQRRLEQISPSTAGLAIQATTDLDRLPISPWAGLGVLAGWAATALLLGALLLRFRDA
jgi:ABC-2 type transport system permease protein